MANNIKFKAPVLPSPPQQYNQSLFQRTFSVLRLYFNQIDNQFRENLNNITIDGTCDITGNTTVGGTLDVTGNTTVGGTLAVTGTTTLNGATTVNNDLLEVVSTDAGADSDPTLSLYRNSASPAVGDDIGKIKFYGNNDAGTPEKIEYAGIYAEIDDETDGTEDGELNFYAIAGGVMEDPVMRLDKNGLELLANNDLVFGLNCNIQFEGTSSNSNDTTLFCVDPTQDNTVLLPNASGTVITTGNLSTITSVGDLSQDVVKIISTDSGAVENPILALYRNSSSVASNDELGAIEFRGNDASGSEMVYGRIYSEISVTGSGSEQANLRFAVRRGGAFEDPVMMIRQYALEIISNNDLILQRNSEIQFEGSTTNSNETKLFVVDPTQDNTVLLPDGSGVLEAGALASGAVVTGTSIAHATFSNYKGQKVVFTGSSNCTIQLPDVAAGDVGATWTVCNAGSANVIFDLNGSGSAQTLKILTGAAVTDVGTDDPHIIPGGVASLVCTAADNYILFGSGVVDN